MKKSKILGSLIQLIVVVLFNALYFGIGGVNHPSASWISYGFIHFSYVMMIITPHITQSGKNRMLYAISMYSISFTYFIIELILGGVIIIVAPEGYKLSLFSQLILTVIYLIILFANMMVDEHTARAVAKHETELAYVKESCSLLKAIMNSVTDKQMYQRVEYAYDLLCASPVKSSPKVYSIEEQVISEINKLSEVVQCGDNIQIPVTVDSIIRLVNERNRLLQLL